MRVALGSLVAAVLLLLGFSQAHEEGKFVCYHYYYDRFGFLVLVPVFHDWDHPHVVSGIMFVHVPHVHHVKEIHHIHEYHDIHHDDRVHHYRGKKHGGGVRHYWNHRPVRHYFRGH